MENGKSHGKKGFTLSNLLLEGSLGVFLAVVLFVVFIIIFSDGFLTSSNFFATSRAFSLWIVVGLGCGAFNGLIIVLTGINAFIVTLGTTSVFTGLNYGLTHSLPFSNIPETFTFIGKEKVLGTIPVLFFVMAVISFILYLMFRHTVIGRRILATGGNRDAAVLSGINTKRITFFVHMLSGVFAGIGGVLFVARLGAAHPTIGQNWLLMSFAVPIIGGTTLQGGKTSIIGAVLGGILMTLISNGLVLLQVDIFWEQFFLGLIVLLAVGVDRARTVYAEKRLY